MIYRWTTTFGLGGRNTQRRTTLNMHTQGNMDLDGQAVKDQAVALALALRGAVLTTTAIMSVKVSEAVNDNGSKPPKSLARVVPVPYFGTRTAGVAGPAVPTPLPDYTSVLLKFAPVRGRAAILKLAGGAADEETHLDAGQYQLDVGSTLVADIEAAMTAAIAALQDDMVIPARGTVPARIVDSISVSGIADFDRKRQRKSGDQKEKEEAKREVLTLVRAAEKLNPNHLDDSLLIAGVNTALQKIIVDLKEIIIRHTGEILAEIIALIPEWLLELLV